MTIEDTCAIDDAQNRSEADKSRRKKLTAKRERGAKITEKKKKLECITEEIRFLESDCTKTNPRRPVVIHDDETTAPEKPAQSTGKEPPQSTQPESEEEGDQDDSEYEHTYSEGSSDEGTDTELPLDGDRYTVSKF